MRLDALQFIAAWLIAQPLLCLAANSTGLTDLVQWDEYSLMVNKERLFIYSGEFHYQRLPVPELWLDVFQKFKANGLNAVSIYFFWSYHSPAPDVFDFDTATKNVQQVLDYAKQAGLYVLARPGPYVNAETNAGGIALWTTDGRGGKYRTSDETYHQAWLPWVKAIGAILAKNQITNGGPVIMLQVENELSETTSLVKYMEQLEGSLRDSGIVVPFFHNEKGMRSISWSTDYKNMGGAVNIYGLDSYPGGLSCLNQNTGFTLVRTYYQWFQNASWTQPSFIPEYRGGWFEPWGGGANYDDCTSDLSPEFADVFYKTLVGQHITLVNFYMTFGGTNWGHSAAPVVFTSYDYSAPLRETREVRDKFKQMKLLGLFTRVSKDLLKTKMESNGTGNAVDSKAIWSWVLRNHDTSAGFYVLEQNDSRSRTVQTFSVTVSTTAGAVKIPNVQLAGRQSRIVVSDYSAGNITLLYSSAEVLTYGLFPNTVLVFYLNQGQVGEFAFKSSSSNLKLETYGANATVTAATDSSKKFTRYTYTQPKGTTIIRFSDGTMVYLLEKGTAYSFWAPPTTSSPIVKPDQQIFVMGPYLVRSATIDNGVVKVMGDNANSTQIEVYAGKGRAQKVEWNGQVLDTKDTPYGAMIAQIPGAETENVGLPALTGWKVADSLPEAGNDYDDTAWVIANKTTTSSPVKPLTLPVLFSSDYGFYSGIKLYRARFDGKTATGANVTAQGGTATGWSAWLNGKFVGGARGNASSPSTSAVLNFKGAMLQDRSNVLTVVTDYNGHDETSTGPSGPENPRGLLGASLLGGSARFTGWKIQGAAGGDEAYIDHMRGPLNEGGLYGERRGWHLPGFDASKWTAGSPTEGLKNAGVNWYITDFDLDVDKNFDIPIGIEFSAPNTTVAQVQLFINGWQFGKYQPHIGPQYRFPIPPGILNMRGSNRVALSLWAQTDAGAKIQGIKLITYGKYRTGFNMPDGAELRPGWTSAREKYA